MTPAELPVLTPADEHTALPEPSAYDKAWYYVFCNQPEKAVYVRKQRQCPAWALNSGDCRCQLLFKIEGETTGDCTVPFDFRNIKTIPEVDDVVITCEGEYIKVMSIEWL